MRLIDADALCMHLSDWQFGEMTDGKHNAEYEVIDKVIDGIEQEPTVDAVRVVRCGECKYFVQKQDNIGECSALLSGKFTGRYWFCADGERREE